jgi:hypothetical protein
VPPTITTKRLMAKIALGTVSEEIIRRRDAGRGEAGACRRGLLIARVREDKLDR